MRQRRSLHNLLSDKADGFYLGRSGLIPLDWENGNHAALANVDGRSGGLYTVKQPRGSIPG